MTLVEGSEMVSQASGLSVIEVIRLVLDEPVEESGAAADEPAETSVPRAAAADR
jgi:hypothetical protein